MGKPREYLTLAAITHVLHLSYSTIRGIVDRGSFIDPDVIVGEVRGWSLARVKAYGVETGRIDEHGNKIGGQAGRPAGQKSTARPAHRRRVPTHYLDYKGVAALTDVSPRGIYSMHRSGRFIDPDVVVGDTYGWSKERASTFIKQIGRYRPLEVSQ